MSNADPAYPLHLIETLEMFDQMVATEKAGHRFRSFGDATLLDRHAP